MSAARGTLSRTSANRITAVFFVDGLVCSYSATVSPSLPSFASNVATVEYSSQDDLTGTRSYSGRIGTNTFQLTMNNGPTIKGKLNPPGVNPPSTVDGMGAWEIN